MLQAAKVATTVAAILVASYFRLIWYPKFDSKNWREVLRAKDCGVAISVALGAWVLVFVIFSSFFLASR